MEAHEFAITIPDFSPGIYSDDHVTHGGVTAPGGSVFQNGAATVANTYRCHSDLTGALVPLPARAARVSEAMLPLGTGHSTNYPPGFQESYQEDIKVCSITWNAVYPGAGDDVLVGVIHGWYYDPAVVGSFGLYGLVRFYQENQALAGAPATFDAHYYRDGAQPTPASILVPWGNFVHTVSHITGQAPNQDGLGLITPAIAWVMCSPLVAWGARHGTALSATDLTYTTYDTDVSPNFISDGVGIGVVAVNHQSGTGGVTFPLSRAAANIATARPNPATLGPLSQNTKLLVGHQGRLISCYGNIQTIAGGFGYGGDEFWYSYYPTYLLHTGTAALPDYAGELVAVPENSSGFGAVASLNAQDLLIIHHYGGGAVVSGSMNSPTVNQLPGLHSTHGISCQGVSTPLGHVYGGRFGVYVYAGGSTQSLSPQLSGFFWDHIAGAGVASNHRQDGTRGRFGWWDPYVLVPNNFLYDTRSKGWWRLELPSSTQEPYSAYDTSAAAGPTSGRLYAMPWRKTSTSTITYDRYDHYVLASTYSWQSQALFESRDRMVTAKTISGAVCPAPGGAAASILFTLTGVDENGATLTPFTATYNFNAANPRPQRFEIVVTDFSAYYMQLRIEASATAGVAAPKVMPGLVITCRDNNSYLMS